MVGVGVVVVVTVVAVVIFVGLLYVGLAKNASIQLVARLSYIELVGVGVGVNVGVGVSVGVFSVGDFRGGCGYCIWEIIIDVAQQHVSAWLLCPCLSFASYWG